MPKPTNRIFCPDCRRQKILFETEKKALNFIKFNADDMENGDKLRAYFCPACCGWHVSHKEHREEFDNRTDKLIEAYKRSIEKHGEEEFEQVKLLYNDLVEHDFNTRFVVRSYIRTTQYSVFVKQEAIKRYYKYKKI